MNGAALSHLASSCTHLGCEVEFREEEALIIDKKSKRIMSIFKYQAEYPNKFLVSKNGSGIGPPLMSTRQTTNVIIESTFPIGIIFSS